MNYGRILFKDENIIKKFNNFISNPKIDINISKFKEKKGKKKLAKKEHINSFTKGKSEEALEKIKKNNLQK